MVYKNPKESKDKTTLKTLALIKERDHLFVSGTYENRKSKLTVYCPEHCVMHQTTFYNYNRSEAGLLCCGREIVRQKLTNRSFSQETLNKMAQSATARGPRGGKDRRWRENASYRNWKKNVSFRFGDKCSISLQLCSAEEKPLVVHHLISAHNCPQLVFEPLNGIVITAELHQDFHKKFGYRNNTVEQFQQYLNLLIEEKKDISTPISSQGGPGGPQGSETRVYDLEQVMELHERLGEISKILIQKLESTT